MDYSSIFELRAASYAEASERFHRVREQELLCFAELLCVRPDERVLDVPAGTGLARDYLPSDSTYVALDPNPEFAMRCKKHSCQIVQTSIRQAGFRTGVLDVIGSLTGLHHEARRYEIDSEWFRMLRPGGRLVIMDVSVGTPVAEFLNEFVDQWNTAGHDGVFLDDDDVSALKDCGFEGVDVKDRIYNWSAESEQQMYLFMCSLFGLDMNPSVAAFSKALQALGVSELNGFSVRWQLRSLCAIKPFDSVPYS